MNTETINVSDLSNETLDELCRLNVTNTNKIVVNYIEFDTLEIRYRIMQLNNVLYKYINMVYGNGMLSDIDTNSEDEKYWLDYNVNEEGKIVSVTDQKDILSRVVEFLINASSNGMETGLILLIESMIDEYYCFKKRYATELNNNVNFNPIIETNLIK